MTDQPRDLAAKVKEIEHRHRSTVIQGWGGEDVDTLLEHIAALSRELEEHRDALRWLSANCVTLSDGKCYEGYVKSYEPTIEPPAHLAAVLAKAMERK